MRNWVKLTRKLTNNRVPPQPFRGGGNATRLAAMRLEPMPLQRPPRASWLWWPLVESELEGPIDIIMGPKQVVFGPLPLADTTMPMYRL